MAGKSSSSHVAPVFGILLLLLGLLLPAAGAAVENDGSTTVELEKDDFYDNEDWNPIAYDMDGYRFEISANETNGLEIDVYILEEKEYGKFKKGEAFKPVFQKQEVTRFDPVDWAAPDDRHYFLIVDNQDIPERQDAYAGRNVTVEISWINTDADKDQESMANAICLFLILFIGVFIYLVKTRIPSFSEPSAMVQGPPPRTAPYYQAGPPQYNQPAPGFVQHQGAGSYPPQGQEPYPQASVQPQPEPQDQQQVHQAEIRPAQMPVQEPTRHPPQSFLQPQEPTVEPSSRPLERQGEGEE